MEPGLHRTWPRSISVLAIPRMKRLMARNHIDETQAQHLMSQQISIERKKDMGDYIIDNRYGFEELYQNIERVLKDLKDETVCD